MPAAAVVVAHPGLPVELTEETARHQRHAAPLHTHHVALVGHDHGRRAHRAPRRPRVARERDGHPVAALDHHEARRHAADAHALARKRPDAPRPAPAVAAVEALDDDRSAVPVDRREEHPAARDRLALAEARQGHPGDPVADGGRRRSLVAPALTAVVADPPANLGAGHRVAVGVDALAQHDRAVIHREERRVLQRLERRAPLQSPVGADAERAGRGREKRPAERPHGEEARRRGPADHPVARGERGLVRRLTRGARRVEGARGGSSTARVVWTGGRAAAQAATSTAPQSRVVARAATPWSWPTGQNGATVTAVTTRSALALR